MRVIGTAGHVDHGKSTLVQALTGIHPDRLKEEREREMTIDLGFAFLRLPNGEELGIIDVPGHRDFIENMLAGIGGIDAALFVVAADEGVMPQTREHLAILDILEIKSGVIALTKIDVVEDTDWLDLIEEELRTVLVGTVLENSEIVRVSAKSGFGLDTLLRELEACLNISPPRPNLGIPRLPIDRIFTVAGFGTVVTGTLVDGIFEVGKEVEILPGKIRGRIRGLQHHNRKEVKAFPGSRTAVNISGVTTEQISRGNWIVYPNTYDVTRRLDLKFRLLLDVAQPMRHNMEVKFFIGATEVVSRVRLLGVDFLEPGAVGWIQLELRNPVIAARGDHYILRRPSPGETIGGGIVVDPHPQKRYKRFNLNVIDRLQALAKGSPEDVVIQAVVINEANSIETILSLANLSKNIGFQTVQNLIEQNRILPLSDGSELNLQTLITTPAHLEILKSRILKIVEEFLKINPLRRGIPHGELKSKSNLGTKLFNIVYKILIDNKCLVSNSFLTWLPGHEVTFSIEQKQSIELLQAEFSRNPYSPPSVKESKEVLGLDVYNALIEIGELVQVSNEVVFAKKDFQKLLEEVKQIITNEEGLTVAGFRDHFNTSRKYALAFLEYLDERGITIRLGDTRRLK